MHNATQVTRTARRARDTRVIRPRAGTMNGQACALTLTGLTPSMTAVLHGRVVLTKESAWTAVSATPRPARTQLRGGSVVIADRDRKGRLGWSAATIPLSYVPQQQLASFFAAEHDQ